MLNTIEAVVFDMDGVLKIGDSMIPGVDKVLENIIKSDLQTMIVTNECRYTEEELRDEFEEFGIHLPKSVGFYTAGMSACDYLSKKMSRFPEHTFQVGIIGESGLYQTLNPLSSFKNCIISNILPSKTDITHNITGYFLIVGAVNRIKIIHIHMLLRWIARGARIITTCPDKTDPSITEDFKLVMPEQILHMAGYNKQINSYSTGKPNPIYRNEIMKRLGITDPSRILFVGDTIYTDIRLAEESGFRSCLVLSGNTKGDTYGSSLAKYMFDPDYVIDDINYLEDILHISEPNINTTS